MIIGQKSMENDIGRQYVSNYCPKSKKLNPWPPKPLNIDIGQSFPTIALCGYPLVKMELEIQTRFLPRLPFSCNSIISDKIWRKMSLSLSIFLVLPQISLVKYYETIKILMQIFWYFRSHFHNVAGPGEKSYFKVFFSA